MILYGITKKNVQSVKAGKAFLNRIYRNRIIRSTERNDASSRSHVIVDLTCELNRGPYCIKSKLRFCDLAGSERFPKTKEVNKDRIKEMSQINLSLSALGRLVNGVNNGYSVKHLARSSMLTKILFNKVDFKMVFFGLITSDRYLVETLFYSQIFEFFQPFRTQFLPEFDERVFTLKK